MDLPLTLHAIGLICEQDMDAEVWGRCNEYEELCRDTDKESVGNAHRPRNGHVVQ